MRQRVREATTKQTTGPLPGRPSTGPLLLTTLSSGQSDIDSRPSPEKAVAMGPIPARQAGGRAIGMPSMGMPQPISLACPARPHQTAVAPSHCQASRMLQVHSLTVAAMAQRRPFHHQPDPYPDAVILQCKLQCIGSVMPTQQAQLLPAAESQERDSICMVATKPATDSFQGCASSSDISLGLTC